MCNNGILVSSRSYSSLSNIEIISPRIMMATFNGNPNTTIISCYNLTNITKKLEVEQFYLELTSLTRNIPKHNMLVIRDDFNAQIGQLNNAMFSYHTNSISNGNMLHNFINKNNLLCLNTHFQKKVGKLWIHKSSNKTST